MYYKEILSKNKLSLQIITNCIKSKEKFINSSLNILHKFHGSLIVRVQITICKEQQCRINLIIQIKITWHIFSSKPRADNHSTVMNYMKNAYLVELFSSHKEELKYNIRIKIY